MFISGRQIWGAWPRVGIENFATGVMANHPRRHGRIGSPGIVRTDLHDDEGEAVSALIEIARRKQRRGYENAQFGKPRLPKTLPSSP